jgi:hypothetical protein
MKKYISPVLDENRLRFTPDGKVVVVDAIRAMMGECCPEWTAPYQERDNRCSGEKPSGQSIRI